MYFISVTIWVLQLPDMFEPAVTKDTRLLLSHSDCSLITKSATCITATNHKLRIIYNCISYIQFVFKWPTTILIKIIVLVRFHILANVSSHRRVYYIACDSLIHNLMTIYTDVTEKFGLGTFLYYTRIRTNKYQTMLLFSL